MGIYLTLMLTLTLSLGVLSGCGGAGARPLRLETYVGELCEAVGPLAADAQQKFAKVLSKYTLRLKSGDSRREMVNALTAVIADSRHVVTTLQAAGTPDIHNGRVLAAAILSAFDKIAESDAAWRSELRAGVWTWPPASRVKGERVNTSLRTFIQIGRQFETLPESPETRNAMARSPVCRELFGVVPVGGRESDKSGPAS